MYSIARAFAARIKEREKKGGKIVLAFSSKEGSVEFMPMHSLASY